MARQSFAVSVSASDWIEVEADSEAEALEMAKQLFRDSTLGSIEATIMNTTDLENEDGN